MASHHNSSSLADAWIHVGPWNNWSNNPWSISTFTTPHQEGLYIVSFISILISAAGNQAWAILCYFIHQWRSGRKPKDVLHHQQQVLLRNSVTNTATLLELTKLSWYWGSIARKGKRRIFQLMLVAIIHFGVFAMAAVLSSRIYRTSDEVLVRSKSCGYLDLPNGNISDFGAQDLEKTVVSFINQRSTADWSLDYSRKCYGGSNEGAECNVFAVPSINSTWEMVPCPFDNSMCVNPDQGAIQVDSGRINTDRHLGINSQRTKSIDYRKVLTCAPLKTQGFTRTVPATDSNVPGDTYIHYYYGQSTVDSRPAYSYTYDVASSGSYKPAYPLDYQVAHVADVDKSSSFSPIPQLQRTDADVTLVFLQNNVNYTARVDDMWFSATNRTPGSIGEDGLWVADDPISVMGCTEQHQFCKSDDECSDLSGWHVVGEWKAFEGEQTVIAQALYNATQANQLSNMVFTLGSDALLANLDVVGQISLVSEALSHTQWEIEVLGWHNYMLARLQRLVVDIATGPATFVAGGPQVEALRKYITAFDPDDQSTFNFCDNMKVRDAAFYSFNVVALAITVIVGVVIIIFGIFLPDIVGFCQELFKKGVHKMEDWQEDHMLHIHRTAFERSGTGLWDGRRRSVPTFSSLEKFPNVSRHSVTASSPGLYAYSPLPAGSPPMSGTQRAAFSHGSFFPNQG